MVKKPKNKGGRPRAKIDLGLVEKLAMLQCTDEELADILGVTVRTITNKKAQKYSGFFQAYKKGKSQGRTSLRRHQWLTAKGVPFTVWKCNRRQKVLRINDCAESIKKEKKGCVDCSGPEETIVYEGSVSMQIWLGKQWLNQKQLDKELDKPSSTDEIEPYDEFIKKHEQCDQT